jgi:hypothetical protein
MMIKDIIANLSTSEQPKVCLPQWSPSRAAGGYFSFHDETRGNLSDGLLQAGLHYQHQAGLHYQHHELLICEFVQGRAHV